MTTNLMTITSLLYYNSFSIIIIRHEYTYLVAATVVLMLFPNIDEPSFLCDQAESLRQPPLSPHYSYIDLFTMAWIYAFLWPLQYIPQG